MSAIVIPLTIFAVEGIGMLTPDAGSTFAFFIASTVTGSAELRWKMFCPPRIFANSFEPGSLRSAAVISDAVFPSFSE